MQQTRERTQIYSNNPSLLCQIVDEITSLDEQSKREVLHKIKMQKALLTVQRADEILKSKPLKMTENDICEMVSDNRKKWNEEK